MRFAVAVAMLAWAAQFSGAAAADLYRWVDPETGSVKFSSYPPPWYGDPAKERRAPKVEVIPERSSAPSSGPKPEDEASPNPGLQPGPRKNPPTGAWTGRGSPRPNRGAAGGQDPGRARRQIDGQALAETRRQAGARGFEGRVGRWALRSATRRSTAAA